MFNDCNLFLRQPIRKDYPIVSCQLSIFNVMSETQIENRQCRIDNRVISSPLHNTNLLLRQPIKLIHQLVNPALGVIDCALEQCR